MNKRILSVVLALCMVFALLPFGASAQAELNGPGCFAHLKDYAMTNGALTDGVYACTAEEDDSVLTLSYDPAADAICLRSDSTLEGGGYFVLMTIPASLEMPYAAEQTITSGEYTVRNEAAVPSDFTTSTQLEMTGVTYEDSNTLFVYGLVFLLTYTQLDFMAGTDYTFGDLGFAALEAELSGAPVITQQPQDFTGKPGDAAVFTVAAEGEGLTYQWQYLDADSEVWLDSSFKTASMSCKATAARSGRQYRCVITDANGNTVTSDAATMTVIAPVITQQPQNFTGRVGETASFSVAASGEDLTYRWQYKDIGGSWTNSSFKTPSISCKITAARDGRQYRCVITDANGTKVTSAAAAIRVEAVPAPVITQQPQSFTGKVGATATFTVAAEGEDLTYQWQYKDAGSDEWLNSSFKTASMSCKITAARDGRQYRCVVTDPYGGKAVSEPAVITVKQPPVITQQPQDVEGRVGETARFSVAAEGEGLTYRWQYKDVGGVWTNSSFKTASMSCKITAERGGRQYRCVITDLYGSKITSEAGTIVVLN